MEPPPTYTDVLYQEVKMGKFENALALLRGSGPQDTKLALTWHVNRGSGWTALHQAAYWGNEPLCRALIGCGGGADVAAAKGETPVSVAREKGHAALASELQRSIMDPKCLWSRKQGLLPSSCMWQEAKPTKAQCDMRVAYAGGTVEIEAGSMYYPDTFGRATVGWHGTFCPPCGMDGESCVSGR